MPPASRALEFFRTHDREIVCAALAFVALHFFDAAAIHPVGAVTAKGIIAALTIPLMGALAYISLDGPSRALVALLFGTLGAVIGIASFDRVAAYGFTGTSVTNVTFALSGIVLLGTCAAVLRRSS
jgi:hypothetical protein